MGRSAGSRVAPRAALNDESRIQAPPNALADEVVERPGALTYGRLALQNCLRAVIVARLKAIDKVFTLPTTLESRNVQRPRRGSERPTNDLIFRGLSKSRPPCFTCVLCTV